VLPLFALANMSLVPWGIDLRQAITHPGALGGGLGLMIGKSLGVLGAILLTSKLLRIQVAETFRKMDNQSQFLKVKG
jgi:Na+/H+ antiporter NhaA